MEEKRPPASRVFYFKTGKEHTRWLLVPVRMGHSRMQRHHGGRQLESGGVWIDPSWKITSRAEMLFELDTVVEIKHAAISFS
jgi:hypothetical protein